MFAFRGRFDPLLAAAEFDELPSEASLSPSVIRSS